MQGSKTKCGDQEQVYWADECCKRNQHYQELYPDPKTRFKNITIPLKLKRSGSTSASGEEGVSSKGSFTVPRPRFSKSSRNSKGSQGSIKAVAFDSDAEKSPGVDFEPVQSVTSLYTRFSEGSAEVINPGLESYLKTLDGEKMETYKLIDDLQSILPELHSEHSPHVVFEQAAERERAESACISILALYKDRYDIFTQPQAPPVRMQEEQWIELQRLICWIDTWPTGSFSKSLYGNETRARCLWVFFCCGQLPASQEPDVERIHAVLATTSAMHDESTQILSRCH